MQNLRLLRKQIKSLPPELAPVAQRVVELEAAILQRYRRLVEQNFAARRIRIHGDLHLGQVLWTGRDFVFLDFEGDATVPISERRIKRSPLRDVARMVRSFHHAAYAGFHQQVELGVIARENLPKFEPWVRHWNLAVSRAFLQAYFRGLEKSEILPRDEEKLRMMLLAYLLNQVMDELGRELRRGIGQRPRAVAGDCLFDGGTAAAAESRAGRRRHRRPGAGAVKSFYEHWNRCIE